MELREKRFRWSTTRAENRVLEGNKQMVDEWYSEILFLPSEPELDLVVWTGDTDVLANIGRLVYTYSGSLCCQNLIARNTRQDKGKDKKRNRAVNWRADRQSIHQNKLQVGPAPPCFPKHRNGWFYGLHVWRNSTCSSRDREIMDD